MKSAHQRYADANKPTAGDAATSQKISADSIGSGTCAMAVTMPVTCSQKDAPNTGRQK